MRHQTYVGSAHTKLVMPRLQHFQIVIQLKVYVLVKGYFVFRDLTGHHIDRGSENISAVMMSRGLW